MLQRNVPVYGRKLLFIPMSLIKDPPQQCQAMSGTDYHKQVDSLQQQECRCQQENLAFRWQWLSLASFFPWCFKEKSLFIFDLIFQKVFWQHTGLFAILHKFSSNKQTKNRQIQLFFFFTIICNYFPNNTEDFNTGLCFLSCNVWK